MARHRHPADGGRSASSPPSLVQQRRPAPTCCNEPPRPLRSPPSAAATAAAAAAEEQQLRARAPVPVGPSGDSRSPNIRHKEHAGSGAAPFGGGLAGSPLGDGAFARLPIGSRSAATAEEAASGPADKEDCDDFVEGGVELSPSKESRDEWGVTDSEDLQTRCLLQLDDQELQELWPPGNGPKAMFLDYDGTLREFEARPEMATPTEEILDILTALDARKDLVPHIISGRDATFLETHFGRFSRFALIAEHGFQISQPPTADKPRCWQLWEQYGGNVRYFKDHENWKSIMRAAIEKLVAASPGSHLEEKQSSLVWHYREVVDEAQGEAAASSAVASLERLREKENIKDVKISHGHKVVEVSYRNVRKGLVMRRLCEEKAIFGEPFTGVLAAGDDVSDETMFEAAPRDFLTIKVGPAATAARFRVDSPCLLRKFLRERIAPAAQQ